MTDWPVPDPSALVTSALARLGVAHRVMECDPAAADTAVFCERYGIAPQDSANTILVAIKRDPRRYVACVVLATTRLDVNHKLREVLGEKRLSFADAEETVAVTGMLVGGVAPFGSLSSCDVVADESLQRFVDVWAAAGSGHAVFNIAVAELIRASGAQVADITRDVP